MQTLAKSLAPVFLSMCALAQSPFTLSGPYTHENLTVFLIHSPASRAPNGFLPLKEAMEQKKVAVYETGNVNELAIENTSAQEVFVQGGDIVKGGRQDRVFTTDMILPPKSGRVPIAAFCVEQGRWTKRGSEDAATFSASGNALPMKESKLAVKWKNDQSAVWNSVGSARAQISTVVAPPSGPQIADSRFSPTSMELALENKALVKSIAPYHQALAKMADGKPDVIGCAFAINGELNSADLYASPELFRQLWPKLLNSMAVEAVANAVPGKTFSAPGIESIENALRGADSATEASKRVNTRTTSVTRDSDKVMLFESRDQAGAWIHRNYIAK
jgi:hypothetical protein